MIDPSSAVMVVRDHVLLRSETVSAVRSVRDGILVETNEMAYRVTDATPATLAGTWQVLDVSQELFSEPPLGSVGLALSTDRVLALAEPDELSEFVNAVCTVVTAAELAELAERYGFRDASGHPIISLDELPATVQRAALPVRLPTLECSPATSAVLRYSSWRLNSRGRIDVLVRTLVADGSPATASTEVLATDIDWPPVGPSPSSAPDTP